MLENLLKGESVGIYRRWIGIEVAPSNNDSRIELGGKCQRLRKLETPISNHDPLACALSTSRRVGAASSWMVRLEAPNRSVARTLINMCIAELAHLTVLQSPSYNVATPSNVILYFFHAVTVSTRFVTNTVKAVIKQVHKTALRLLIQPCRVFARGFSGVIAGNHGSKSFTLPNVRSFRCDSRSGVA